MILALICFIALPKFLLTDVVFSFLYLLPVGLCTWWFGYAWGLSVAVFCGSLSGVMNYYLAIQPIQDLHALYWNTGIRYFVFTVFAIFIQMFQWELFRQTKMAATDPHTGLLNLRGFFGLAEKRLEQARKHGDAIAMLYLDMDHFKEVNDKMGHLEGDRALRAVATAMKTSFHSPDLASRVGGDEFLAFQPKIDIYEFRNKMKEFRQHLNGRMQAGNWPVTFSIGCVVYLEPQGSLEQIIHEADLLASEVKNNGRNGVKLEIR